MNRIKTKLYYKFCRFFLRRRLIRLSETLKTKKNIFIYFDYEREFGGHNTSISDKDVSEILRILDVNNIKTTWFTVGKVFGHYPESVKEVITKGHEVGSHTYSHIAPLDVSRSELREDFIKFSEAASEFNSEISGFHSPYSRWSLRMIKYLRDFDFRYDLIHCKKNEKCYTQILKTSKDNGIIRLQTVGDDWPVYGKDLDVQEISRYFEGLLARIGNGDIAGIGFHPWVLFSDKKILRGFNLFINYLKTVQGLCIKPARDFVAELTEDLKN